jgi:hypothetical protein
MEPYKAKRQKDAYDKWPRPTAATRLGVNAADKVHIPVEHGTKNTRGLFVNLQSVQKSTARIISAKQI